MLIILHLLNQFGCTWGSTQQLEFVSFYEREISKWPECNFVATWHGWCHINDGGNLAFMKQFWMSMNLWNGQN